MHAMARFRDYVITRCLLMIPTILGVLVITFIISRMIPGDPVLALMGEGAIKSPQAYAAARHRMGLDLPLIEQFYNYMIAVFHGDLGQSVFTKRPVFEDLMQYFPATLELALFGVFLAVAVGLPLGVLAAIRRNTILDDVIRTFAVVAQSTPGFWLGMMLLAVLYFRLGFAGLGRIGIDPPTHITGFFILDSVLTGNMPALGNSLQHIVLPALCLALLNMGMIARISRSSMIDVLHQEFVTALRAKGLSERMVIYRHALKNSLVPTVTIIGLTFGWQLSGSVTIETAFSWPGMGRYAVGSMMNLDFPSIMGVVIIFVLCFMFVNLIVDLLYGFLDPRIRYG